jgi:cell division protein FtsB
MTLQTILNPQFLGSFSLGLLAAYLFYTMIIDNKNEKQNEITLDIHTATYNSAKSLYKAVEQEMANKLINSSIISSNSEVVKLTSQVKELEERKNNLIQEIAKLEKGEYGSIVEEIKIIRNEIATIYNSIEKELNPVMRLLEKGKTKEAEHNFKGIQFKNKNSLEKTDKLLSKKPNFLK